MSSGIIYSSLVSDPDFAFLVSEFVEQIPNRVSAIRVTMAERSISQLCVLVHQLRGACGSYGFHDVTPLATSLEMSIRSGKSIEELTVDIETFLELCLRMTSDPA